MYATLQSSMSQCKREYSCIFMHHCKGLPSQLGAINKASYRAAEHPSKHTFLFGDYAFLCSLFGLSGQNGTHPCLWCLIKKSDARRTLSKIKRDHEKFEAAGPQLKLASSYNNVIHKPLLDIHISHVCPPYLHILLGIVKKHHDLFENDLHELDLALANDPSVVTTLVPDNLPLHTYIQNLKKLSEITSKAWVSRMSII